MHPVIATFPLPFRPFMSCRLDLPPLSSRPSPAVDQRERSHAAIIRPNKSILGNTRFLASRRNDCWGRLHTLRPTGNNEISRCASKWQRGRLHALRPIGDTLHPSILCRLDLPPLSSRPAGEISCGHHPPQERHPRQHEISRFVSKWQRWAASHLSPYWGHFAPLHPLSPRPSPAVISTNGRDLMRPSSAPRKASSATRDFSLRVEMTAGVGFTPFALPGTTGFLASLEMTTGAL